MRYASLNGGKRVRAMLVYAAGEAVGVPLDVLDTPACAVELVHAYSLVHDDLPAMDDDALRRGKPACHVAFGEATAILAGDGLQSLAFELLAGDDSLRVPVSRRLMMIERLAAAAGFAGMVGGQARDIAAEGTTPDVDQLTRLHLDKTGALIQAAVHLGALCGDGSDPGTLDLLDRYAERIGLAFQIIDDILDQESDTETLGKSSGADRAHAKATFPSVIGMEASKAMARKMYEEAVRSLDKVDGNTHLLLEISKLVVDRRH